MFGSQKQQKQVTLERTLKRREREKKIGAREKELIKNYMPGCIISNTINFLLLLSFFLTLLHYSPLTCKLVLAKWVIHDGNTDLSRLVSIILEKRELIHCSSKNYHQKRYHTCWWLARIAGFGFSVGLLVDRTVEPVCRGTPTIKGERADSSRF